MVRVNHSYAAGKEKIHPPTAVYSHKRMFNYDEYVVHSMQFQILHNSTDVLPALWCHLGPVATLFNYTMGAVQTTAHPPYWRVIVVKETPKLSIMLL